jgi:hypothetical protein
MISRLGIAFLAAFAMAAAIAAGCSKYGSTTSTPSPVPTASVSPAPDTIYVQTSANKQIRGYRGASTDNGLTFAFLAVPDNDTANGDVIYDPASDTMWYPRAYPLATPAGNRNTPIYMWMAASTKTGKNPDVTVPFVNGFGAASYDVNHNLLYVSVVTGPQVSVFASATTMTNASVPGATITLNMTDSGPGTPRPQEFLYDKTNDRLYVSDAITEVAVFDNFGAAAAAAVTGATNPTIAPNRYIQGLVSPDGMAYELSNDTLFVGEQSTDNDVIIIANASTFSGPVTHAPKVTGFAKPAGMAYDAVRDLLFVYDTQPIYVIPHPATASGPVGGIVNHHVISDASTTDDGFGFALDTTH